jgi:3'(2'), 5'-bisphosphate nucleotidase
MIEGVTAGPDDDAALARDLAGAAGRVLIALRAGGLTGADLKAAGDAGSHDFLMAELARLRPLDAVLSEEGQDDPARLSSRRVWIIDPLDGTREFSELDRDDWAVHVALWEDGELVAGAVALPAQGTVLSTATPPQPQPRPAAAPLRIAASRSRPPVWLAELATELGGELVPMGSAGAKTSAVLLGVVDAYVHGGGQYEWDSAAPVAVARAGGFWATRVDGSPLVYNSRNPWLPDLVVAHPEIAGTLVAALQTVGDTQEIPSR